MRGVPDEIVVDPEGLGGDMWALTLMRRREGIELRPELAVRPRSTEEVAACVRWAAELGLAVVARGGGSGVCGAAQASSGAMVVDMTAMDTIISTDPESMTVALQTGIMGPELESHLAANGMTLGHVPQSMPLSTLGGWIATKAMGQLSTLYGGIEDRLLGLTAVLADGTVVSSRPSPRASTGPDWFRMFLGAEGTLGIVTEATLECFPVPQATRWVCTAPEDFPAGIEMLRAIIHAGLRPSVARLYDRADAAVSFASIGLDRPAVSILRFEGHPDLVDAQARLAVAMVEGAGAELLDDAAGAHWWGHRFDAIETYQRILGPEGPLGRFGAVDTMEVAAPWASLPRVYEQVADAFAGHADVVLAHVSHLYPSGANIYFTFLINSAGSAEEVEERYLAAWDAAVPAAHAAGATMSHHHGVGLLKSAWMGDELGSGIQALRRLKSALDPDGRMNPGKLGL